MFEPEIYKTRRKKLTEKLPETYMAILPPSSSKSASADEMYSYVPNKNLSYLTGITQANTWLIMYRAEREDPKEILFINDYDEEYAKWFGTSITKEKAALESGIEDIRFNNTVQKCIDKTYILKQIKRFFIDFPLTGLSGRAGFRQDFAATLKAAYPHLEHHRLSDLIFELRMIKENEEVEKIREAIELTNKGFKRALSLLRPGVIEYEIETEILYEWMKAGEKYPAFPSIVSGGARATCLHYSDNNKQLLDGELLLLDFGAKKGLYNADISRTVPVNGKYTKRQRDLIHLVIEIQEEAIHLLRPGKTHAEWNSEVNKYYAGRLVKFGLIENEEKLEEVFYHRIGHHIGLDTHDENLVNTPIRPGMVFTVEPGLYIAEESIGIRIEDDVLVGETENEILSSGIPKTPDEIEAFMKSR